MLGFLVTFALLQTPVPAGGAGTAPTSTPAAASTPATTPVATTPAASTPATTASASPATATPAGSSPASAAPTPGVTATTEPLAKAATATAPAAQPQPSPFTQFLPFLPIIPLVYFMMIRPQKQEEKKRRDLLNRMQKNDKVITAGGMYGTIVAVNPENETVTLRLGADPGVKVDFTKASVVRVISAADKKDTV